MFVVGKRYELVDRNGLGGVGSSVEYRIEFIGCGGRIVSYEGKGCVSDCREVVVRIYV